MRIVVDRFQPDAADIKPFVDAFLRLFNDNDSLRYLSFTNVPFTEDTLRSWVRQSGDMSVEYYTATDDGGHIIGILAFRADKVAGFEIIGVAVDSRERGRGIGTSLVETAIRKADEYGFSGIDVAVYADNKEMLSLAIRHDFKPVRIDYHRRFDGEDIVYLKRYRPKNKYTMT